MPCPMQLASGVQMVRAACAWCETELMQLAQGDGVGFGDGGEAVKRLQRHLQAFGMNVELGEWKARDATFHESADLVKGTWGAPTTRAVRMFGLHPAVGWEPTRVIETDGRSVTPALALKIREWCCRGTVSPQNYWEMKDLRIVDGDCDAAGAGDDPTRQTVLHDFVVQIERDLMATGFAVHDDARCGCGLKASHKPRGVYASVPENDNGQHEDRRLGDLPYLIRKFQRQAEWLWRMKRDGTHLDDAVAGDPSVYGGGRTGQVDPLTARVLRAWVTGDLHMVVNKFSLEELHWPPESGEPILNAGGKRPRPARLRRDAYEVWLRAAKEIHHLNATIAGPYASSARGWERGKPAAPVATAADGWHFAGLAVDLSKMLQLRDATITRDTPHGLEMDGDRFRLWCYVVPQPPAPGSPTEDYDRGATVQYRNRNLRAKVDRTHPLRVLKSGAPVDPHPLFFVATRRKPSAPPAKTFREVTARAGWYVDVTKIMESHGLLRVPRREGWLTNHKAWQWWHYRYQPELPPGATGGVTFGDYLQLCGVHEYRLRNVRRGWSTHEDIEQAPT